MGMWTVRTKGLEQSGDHRLGPVSGPLGNGQGSAAISSAAFLAVQWLGLALRCSGHAFNAGQRTKIPQAAQHDPKRNVNCPEERHLLCRLSLSSADQVSDSVDCPLLEVGNQCPPPHPRDLLDW